MADEDIRRRQQLVDPLLSRIDHLGIGRGGLNLIDVTSFNRIAENNAHRAGDRLDWGAKESIQECNETRCDREVGAKKRLDCVPGRDRNGRRTVESADRRAV